MVVAIHPLSTLEARRRELGMSIEVLAKRSGVSVATVKRVLHNHGGSRFDAVQAIAHALGEKVAFEEAVDADTMLEQQARKKAEQLVGITQGTCALEGQGVSEQLGQSVVRQTVHRLLAGSRGKLWAF